MARDEEKVISDEEFSRITLAAIRRGVATTTRDKRARAQVILNLVLEVRFKMTQEKIEELVNEVEVAKIIRKVHYQKMSPEKGAEAIYEFSRKSTEPQ